QWQGLAHALDKPEWLDDERFKTPALRAQNIDARLRLTQDELIGRRSAEWLDRLTRADVPCGPVLTRSQMIRHPHVQAMELVEECGLEYRVIPVNIGKGDQFKPEFLAISPNNRMPAIIDYDAEDGPLPVFESGAILIHLAERAGRFMPEGKRARKELLEWLFWQVGNLGPMAGQLSHFVNYAQGEHPYSHQRYADEYNRCLGVLERRLDGREFILGEYSIADMASWPWVLIAKPLGQPLDAFPNVPRLRA